MAAPAIVLLLALLAAAAPPAARAAIPAIFTFGDSTADVGTNNYLPGDPPVANIAPYGEDYIPRSGRFSDGLLVGDYFAKQLRLPSAPPYLKPRANFKGGANFASGGAGVLPTTNFNRTVSLRQQVAQFSALQGTKAFTPKVYAAALYFITIGGNDYLTAIPTLATSPNATTTISSIVTRVIGTFASVLQQLYGSGARKFLISDVTALGCLPEALAALGAPRTGPPCNALVDDVAAAHNAALKALLRKLRRLPGTHFSIINSNGFLRDVVTRPRSYGFTVPSTACCGAGPYQATVPCGRSATVAGRTVKYKLCKNVQQHVFWDDVHPTQHLYSLLASRVYYGNTESVSPINLRAISRLP